MLEFGGVLGLFVSGLVLALFVPHTRPAGNIYRAAQNNTLCETSQHTNKDDNDVTFQRSLASTMDVDDDLADTQFGSSGTAAFDDSGSSRIRDFVQGTDILEVEYGFGDGRMDLSLDPNRAGGTNVVLNGELVAVVDNVLLMGADVVIKPNFDPVGA